MIDVFIGIDIGTSSVKVLAINNKHEIVGTTKKLSSLLSKRQLGRTRSK